MIYTKVIPPENEYQYMFFEDFPFEFAKSLKEYTYLYINNYLPKELKIDFQIDENYYPNSIAWDENTQSYVEFKEYKIRLIEPPSYLEFDFHIFDNDKIRSGVYSAKKRNSISKKSLDKIQAAISIL